MSYHFNEKASEACKAVVADLKAKGWKPLGEESCYGLVMGHDALPDLVAKIAYRAHDDGWVPFARHVMANPSPVFPEIYELEDHGDFVVATMERLAPLDYSNDALWSTYCTASSAVETEGDYWEREKASLPEALANGLQLVRDRFMSEWQLDLHSGNFMVRGSDLVVIDPLSYRRAVS